MPLGKKKAPVSSDDLAINWDYDPKDGVYDMPTSPVGSHSLVQKKPEKKGVGSRQVRHARDQLGQNLATSNGSRHAVCPQESPKRKGVGGVSKRLPKKVRLSGMEEADKNDKVKAGMPSNIRSIDFPEVTKPMPACVPVPSKNNRNRTRKVDEPSSQLDQGTIRLSLPRAMLMPEPVMITSGCSSSGQDPDGVETSPDILATTANAKDRGTKAQVISGSQDVPDTQQIADCQLPGPQDVPNSRASRLIPPSRRQGQEEHGRRRTNPAETDDAADDGVDDGFTAATSVTPLCHAPDVRKVRFGRALSSDVGQTQGHESSEGRDEMPNAPVYQTSLHAVFNELPPAFVHELAVKQRVVQNIVHVYQAMGAGLLQKMDKMRRKELIQYASAYEDDCRHFTSICDSFCSQMIHFEAELRVPKADSWHGDKNQRQALGKLNAILAKLASSGDGDGA